jgi:hypothetical protein
MQDVPQDVAIALTTEWIKAMMGFAKDQSKQADVLAQWLASQKIINRG